MVVNDQTNSTTTLDLSLPTPESRLSDYGAMVEQRSIPSWLRDDDEVNQIVTMRRDLNALKLRRA